MRLSEAIRLGAMMQPKRNGPCAILYKDNNGTCALGAAAQAVGLPILTLAEGYSPIWAMWPWLQTMSTHPITGVIDDATTNIWMLNDTDDWTRERIADWVSTIEPKENHDLQPLADESGNEVHQVQQEAIQGR
jgi:hypothetical protein